VVVDRENGAAGQPEDRVDALLFEAPNQCLRSCELHNVPLFLDKQKGLPFLGGLRSTCERDYRRRAPTTTTRMSLRVVTYLSKHMGHASTRRLPRENGSIPGPGAIRANFSRTTSYERA